MICDSKDPLCIAGVFGGLSSAVKSDTKEILLESAYFNPTTIRKLLKDIISQPMHHLDMKEGVILI